MTDPPTLTAAEFFLSIDHLVDSMLSYAEPAALAKLMQVNVPFYELAGRLLYTTLTVSGVQLHKFLICNGKESRKAYKKIRLGKSIRNLRAKYKTKEERDSKSVESEDSNPNPPSIPRPPRLHSFAFIRVLSIGSHRGVHCEIYGQELAKLTPNLEVLRIVQGPETPLFLGHYCDHYPCRLLTHLRPRKLVFRNTGDERLPIPGPRRWIVPSSVEEVVVVLPTDEAVYAGTYADSRSHFADSLRGQFTTAIRISLVFCDEWEDIPPKNSKVSRRPSFNFVDTIAEILKEASSSLQDVGPRLSCTQPLVTVYGLETLDLPLTDKLGNSRVSRWAEQCRTHYGTDDPNDLHAVVRNLVLDPDGVFPLSDDQLVRREIEFKTKEEYLGDPELHKGEISAIARWTM